jgi:hypothetical protein
MTQTMRGVVHSGGVVLPAPLDLPDGTEVIVSAVLAAPAAERLSTEGFKALPVFGMQRDIADGRDGVEIINEEREKWAQRPRRRD